MSEEKYGTFVKKVWTGGFILALILTIFVLFRETVHIFILILVGALIACYFRGLAALIHKKWSLSHAWSLTISIIGSFIIFIGLFVLIGTTVVSQTQELKENFPKLIETADEFLANTAVGNELETQFNKIVESDGFAPFLSHFFKTSFGGIGDLYVILLVGIYFTSSPKIYRKGILYMVPPRNREKADTILNNLANGLTKWLFGKFFSMTLVFVLTAIALAIIGLPMWLALAFIAGLLVFIPNFGPIIAAVPTLLVALSEGTQEVIIVGILFFLIQIAEGSFITPKVQQRLISIPPALIILGQIFGGTLVGAWGIVFATPIVLILMILVKELYIKPMEERQAIIEEAN